MQFEFYLGTLLKEDGEKIRTSRLSLQLLSPILPYTIDITDHQYTNYALAHY